MPSNNFKYTRVGTLVHGKSELLFSEFICSNLHLKHFTLSENKGRKSIQINGLLKGYLKKKPFNNLKAFADEYNIEYDKKNKKLKNFRLFIIMDTDDCDETTANRFKNKEMFIGHVLEPYIVPIFNDSNLEDVMLKAGIMTKRIKDSEKGTYYTKIFPINGGSPTTETLPQIEEFARKIKGIPETNMIEFIDYCKSLL